MHHLLKDAGHVAKANEHHDKFVKPKTANKGHLKLMPRGDTYLMKTLGKIKLVKPLGRGQALKQVIYPQQRIAIMHSMLV